MFSKPWKYKAVSSCYPEDTGLANRQAPVNERGLLLLPGQRGVVSAQKGPGPSLINVFALLTKPYTG